MRPLKPASSASTTWTPTSNLLLRALERGSRGMWSWADEQFDGANPLDLERGRPSLKESCSRATNDRRLPGGTAPGGMPCWSRRQLQKKLPALLIRMRMKLLWHLQRSDASRTTTATPSFGLLCCFGRESEQRCVEEHSIQSLGKRTPASSRAGSVFCLPYNTSVTEEEMAYRVTV